MVRPRRLRAPGRDSRWRILALAALLAAGPLAAPVAGQEGGGSDPLSKADVIRLLTADPESEEEIARTVRRRCIAFRLTDRDRGDFRELGAAPTVMEALEACSARRSALTVSVFPGDTLYGLAGDTVSVMVTARRGGEPAAGVPITLRGVEGAPTATTNQRGVARLDFVAGRESGTRTLEISSPREPVSGPATLPMVVRASRPAAVRLWPPILTLEPDGDDAGEVLAIVTDRFGNSVPGAPVVARDSTADSGGVLASAVTDGRGEAVLRIPGDAVDERAVVGVWARGARLGAVTVRRPAPEAPAIASAAEPGERSDSSASGRGAGETELAAAAEDRAGEDAEPRPEQVDDAPEDTGRNPEAGGAPEGEREPVAEGSIPSLRRAAADSLADAAAWMELARAWRIAGRTLEARSALLRAREVAAGADRDSVDAALSRVEGVPPGLRIAALGGSNVEGGGTAGLRFAEARFRPAAFLAAWGRYDRSLGSRVPALVRGPDQVDAFWSGIEVEWGTPSRLVTLVEAGRREYRDVDLAQNLLRVEQGIRVPTDLGHLRVRAGGVLGRWFDRDDWLAYVRAAIPVALWADLKPSLWAGETMGTDLHGVGREPGREVRGVLGVEVRPASGLRIEPSVGVGHVEADLAEAAGALWEAELAISIPVASSAAVELVARHQSPPGSEGFTVLVGGLRLGRP